jgi:4'-phosphopantetheinyl transferase
MTMPAASTPPPLASGTAHDYWTPGPAHPLLCERAVDVWRADLAAVTDDFCALLCREERARAARMPSERDRRLWMRSRGVLRVLLGRYVGKDPATLQFVASARGKPALVDHAPVGSSAGPEPESSAVTRMQFNLSHSGGLALYAFADGVPVGVDVELARRPIDEVAIASRTFGAAEAERLRKLDTETRRREFLRAWVRHEARLKCLGVGIAGAAAARGKSVPWIAELQMGPRGAGAVAVEVAPRELRCWEWASRPSLEPRAA